MKPAAVLLCLALSACSLGRLQAPKATVTTPAGAIVKQSGPAEIPANVTVSTSTSTLPIPAGSVYVIPAAPNNKQPPAENKQQTVTLSADSVLSVTTKTEHAEAPRAFTPPAPPTAAQQAAAAGIRWFYVAALLGFIAAGLLAWTQHYLAAVKVAAGALCLPILAHFFSSAVAMTVSAALIALGLGVWLAWHLIEARKNAP